MKTVCENVVKAVNWLKGDIANSDDFGGKEEFVFFSAERGVYGTSYSKHDGDFDIHHVCTIAEFNALLAEMENNFGKYTGAKFDASKATKLEVSKVDIDWSEAPEGATYWMPSGEFWQEAFIKVVDGNIHVWRSRWYLASGHSVDSLLKLGMVERPQPPVYTQEMLDNGECPQVGAKLLIAQTILPCHVLKFIGLEVEVIGICSDLSGRKVITFEHEEEGVGCILFLEHFIKPLPPKQELEDGEAYSFEVKYRGRMKGVYMSVRDIFYCVNADIAAKDCTNITLLTPEGK